MSAAEKSFLGPDGVSQVWDAVKGRRVEMTLGEYNALSQEEKDNPDILYIITDDNSMGIDQPGNVYSMEETKVGTWVDGRPIYRMGYNIDCNLPSDGTVDIDTRKDIDFIISSVGYSVLNSGGKRNNIIGQCYVFVGFNEVTKIITFEGKGNTSGKQKGCFTIDYVKIGDGK